MIGKLLRFYFRTRLPRGTLLFSAIFYAFLLAPGFLYYYILPPVTSPSVFFYELFTFMLVALFLSVYTGSVSSMKSDRDFYFVLPVDKRDLIIPLVAFKFYSTGTLLLALVFDISSVYRSSGTTVLQSLLAAVAISVGTTFIGITMMTIRQVYRVLVSIIVVAWAAIEIIGSPLALITLATSSLLYGVSLSLAFLAIPVIISMIVTVDLGIEKFSVERGSTRREARKLSTFAGLTQKRAILKFHTTFVSTNMRRRGYSNFAPSFRLRTRTGLIITSLFAIVYFYVLYFYQNSFGAGTSLYIIVYVTFYAVLLIVTNTPNLLNNERLWTSFLTMKGSDYFVTSILSKCVSELILLAPFIAANFVLAFYGVPYAFNSALVLMFMVPSVLVITFYFFSEKISYQDLQGGALSGNVIGRNFIVLIPGVIFFAVSVAATYYFPFLAASLIAMGSLSFYLIRRGRRWGKIVTRLSEQGFV
ncbi:MAG: hypothetical protein QW597_01840 [Thermoplasmataceae archaeon]